MATRIEFYPIDADELLAFQRPLIPRCVRFCCGTCGDSTNGRIVAAMKREPDGARIAWTLCACPAEEPTILIQSPDGRLVHQLPGPREFRTDEKWPDELGQLFNEGVTCFAAGAFTASSMISRKLLMVCACNEGDTDGKSFASYVNFITHNVLNYPKARDAIDKIRDIGNDANHDVAFVNEGDARLSLQIVYYMLNSIYSLPSS